MLSHLDGGSPQCGFLFYCSSMRGYLVTMILNLFFHSVNQQYKLIRSQRYRHEGLAEKTGN